MLMEKYKYVDYIVNCKKQKMNLLIIYSLGILLLS